MKITKPKPALFRWIPVLAIVLVVTASLLFMVWAISDGSVEANLDELRSAAENLRKNPQDKQSLSVLVKQLTHRNRLYRSNAAAVLGEAAPNVGAAIAPEAVPALAKLLAEGDIFNQRAAASALRRFGEHARPALPVLRKRLTPSDSDVAWYSAEAIGNIGSPAAEAVPDLTLALKDQASRCRGYFSPCFRSFIPAIGAIGPGAITAKPDLEQLLDYPDPYLRMAAAVALLQIEVKHQRANTIIDELLKSDDVELKERTLLALKESGVSALP
jgi:HEAT repeat protein